ncbi:MAG: phosphatase family protein [Enterovirga sp.]|nr:phosphatase family protein [Enterovirga sp.]
MLGAGLALKRPKVAEAGARMLGSVLLATALKSAVKRLVSRTRPNVLLDEGIYAVEPLGPDEGPWHSFPSGHTADATAMARALARVYPGATLPAYGAALAIGAVQVPRGAHYPVDVAAGLVVGAAAEAIVHQAARAAHKRLARHDEVTAGSPLDGCDPMEPEGPSCPVEPV